MEPFLSAVRTLMQAAARCAQPDSSLRLVSLDAILADLLAGTALGAEPIDIIAAPESLAEQLAQQPSDGLAERFRRAGELLEDILLLERVPRTQVLREVSLEPNDISIFDYIERWDLPTSSGEPPITLVGSLQMAVAPTRLQLRSEHFAARRTTLTFERRTPYPHLSLSVLSAAPISAMRGERADWEQRAVADYRLQVFTGGRKLAGQIETTALALPITLDNGRLHLTIPAPAGIKAFCTTVSDDQGRAQARCVRLWRDTQ